MKKFLLMAAVATTLVNCSSDFDLSEGQGGGGVSDVIGFQVQGRNSIKRGTLQGANHYNFGVFAYKSTDQTNNIMDNYLVGYFDDANAYTKSGSTTDDKPGQVDGKSNWMYEGMGWAQFHGTYAGENVEKGSKYASNNENQYLRYWDNSAESTCFYAYVPYLNKGAVGATVSYVDGTAKGTSDNTDKYVMTFPNGTIQHGYDDVQAYEYMYASTKVGKANYGHDVQLEFKRLNAKVNIKFWEDIPGYSVHMIDLGNDVNGNYWTISAVPSIKEAGQGTYGYKLGKIYTSNGVKIQFANGAKTDIKQYKGATSQSPLAFATPTDAQISDNRPGATPSKTTYYAIPKGSSAQVLTDDAANIGALEDCDADLAKTGLTFHVSYELISTTGEKITVKDATVHVGKEYCKWEENKAYTYIFKITTNSNGSTGDVTPDPTNPAVPTEPALYPIVFDNCTVEDWVEEDYESDITEGADNTWYDVKLDFYSFNNTADKDITVTVDRTSKNPQYASPTNPYPTPTPLTPTADQLSVKDPNGDAIITDGRVQSGYESWDINGNKITVPKDVPTGKYTITYTPSDDDVRPNHPDTYTENFYVGSECAVQTNLPAVATNAEEPFTYLQIKTQTNGVWTTATTNTGLSINYPINLTTDEKNLVKVTDGKVEVAKAAKPGKYELVYTVENSDPVVVKYVFEVKDYGLSLSKNVVELGASPVKVVATTGYTGANYTISCDPTRGVTQSVDPDNKTFSIANNADEVTHTITLVVDNGDDTSKATYKKTFEVKNTYEVNLSKGTIRRDFERDETKEFGSDFITITTKKNGVATAANEKLMLKIYDAHDIEVTGNFEITYNSSNNEYKLQVKGKTVSTPNGTYTLKYTGDNNRTVVKTTFIVQN